MTKDYKLQVCSQKKQWDEFVKVSPQGNIFCQSCFLDALQKDYELLLVAQGDANLLGAVVVKDEDGQPIPQPFMYHGVLFNRSVANSPTHTRVKKSLELVSFLLLELEQRYERISFSLHHSFEDLRSFQWFHYHEPELGQFEINLCYTGLIDLSAIKNIASYCQEIRRNRLRDYSKSQSEALIIKESDAISVLDKLHEMTFNRQGIQRSELEKQLLWSVSEMALSKGLGRMLICYNKQGYTCSAYLFLYDSKCGYSMFGASDPKFNNTGNYSYLTLECLRRCKELGLSSWDFLGINSPNRGDFKTSFNAAPVPYYTVAWEKKK